MKFFDRIITKIEIQAPPEKVWNALLDFKSYPLWNPFIISISGHPTKGEKLQTQIVLNENKSFFYPKVVRVSRLKEFAWIGIKKNKLIFYGNHYFKLQPLTKSTTLFIHGERFGGLQCAPILKKIKEPALIAFNQMNIALKNYVEQGISNSNKQVLT